MQTYTGPYKDGHLFRARRLLVLPHMGSKSAEIHSVQLFTVEPYILPHFFGAIQCKAMELVNNPPLTTLYSYKPIVKRLVHPIFAQTMLLFVPQSLLPLLLFL